MLPFVNMSGNPEHEFFADGLTEDIITALARLNWLFVIARNSTFVYKNKPTDVREVARELGVRYVLEGSVRVADRRIRITGQLIEAETGKHVWAERYDRVLEDLFAVQDEIAEHVVGAVEPHLYAEEGYRAARHQPGRIDAWGLAVRALNLINKIERRQNEEAREMLAAAIDVEPGYARAHALLGWAKWWAALCYWFDERREGYRQAAAHAQNALALDAAEPWARMVSGLCLSTDGQHDRALGELRVALTLNPSFALGHMAYGWALLRAGAIRRGDRRDRAGDAHSVRSTTSRASTRRSTASPCSARERFSEALPFLRMSVAAFAEYSGHYNTLISCCGHLGLIAEAQEYIAVRNRIGPPLRLGVLRENLKSFAHRDDVHRRPAEGRRSRVRIERSRGARFDTG